MLRWRGNDRRAVHEAAGLRRGGVGRAPTAEHRGRQETRYQDTESNNTNVIVFASQKGGSGKTTLSGHIAIAAELSGAGPVAVIDTDPQRSLAQWRYAREDNGLILKVSDVENIHQDIEELRALGAKTIVIDTPPAATSAIGEVVRHADLVCIPTRPSPHDLRAVGATIDIVESHRKPMVFVLNSAASRAKITSEAALALSQHGTVAPTFIHNRVDFAASMTDGRTVMEVNEGSKSSAEVAELWSYIGERIEKISEWAHEEPAPAAEQPAAPPAPAAPPPRPAATTPPEPAEPAVAPPEPVPSVVAPPPAPAAEPAPPVAAAPPPAAEAPSPKLMESPPPEPRVEESPEPSTETAPTPRPKTPTAEEFFGQRRAVKTPTYFGPDRRRKDGTPPSGVERRAPAFGRRTSS
jgi:chromosome partitioning protein